MASAAAAVDKLIEPWTRACIDGDWDTVMSMCNDDIVMMPPGDSVKKGAAEVRSQLEAMDIKQMSWSVADLHEEGDIAYLYGPVTQTLVIDGQEQKFDGKYCDVVRRGNDGSWRFSLIMWSPNAE